MGLWIPDGWPMLDDITLAANDDSGTDRSLDLFAVHHFLAESGVFFHRLRTRIGQEYIWQIVFCSEFFMRCKTVLAYSQNNDVEFFQLLVKLAEPASLLGSARRAVFRIEKQYDGLALVRVEGMRPAITTQQAKRRRLFSYRNRHKQFLLALM